MFLRKGISPNPNLLIKQPLFCSTNRVLAARAEQACDACSAGPSAPSTDPLP